MSTWTPERGLVVVAATDMEDRVEAQIQRGMDVVKKQVQRAWAEDHSDP